MAVSYETVVSQIREYCPCFVDTATVDLEEIARQIVDLVSRSTCWSREPCETLLREKRVETVPAQCAKACTCDNIVRFRPYYQYGIDLADIRVFLVSQVGVSTVSVELSPEDGVFGLSDVAGFYEILVDGGQVLPACGCQNSCEHWYLRFEYMAGYDGLPACLFPEVCEIIKTISAFKLGCGGLDECCETSDKELGYKLTSKRVGELSWSWKQDKDSIEYLYASMVKADRIKALGLVSLCGTDTLDEPNLWASVADESVDLWGYKCLPHRSKQCKTCY